jgi:hypothetical protein
MKRKRLSTNCRYMVTGPLFVLALHFGVVLVAAQTVTPIVPPGPGISFSSLTGTNGAPYVGDTEGDFTVTPTAGSWFQSTNYGNPTPSIYVGPINSPGIGTILISDRVGPFKLSSFDFSSNNGDSSYDVQGYLGQNLEYEETGTLDGSFPPGFGFQTVLDTHAAVPIDGLIIEIIPGAGVTSINLDNIMVTTIPEPRSSCFLAVGLAYLWLCGKSFGTKIFSGSKTARPLE